jgi:hypothetical protein
VSPRVLPNGSKGFAHGPRQIPRRRRCRQSSRQSRCVERIIQVTKKTPAHRRVVFISLGVILVQRPRQVTTLFRRPHLRTRLCTMRSVTPLPNILSTIAPRVDAANSNVGGTLRRFAADMDIPTSHSVVLWYPERASLRRYGK